MRKRNIIILAAFAAVIALVLLLPKKGNPGNSPGGAGNPGNPGAPRQAAVFSVRTETVRRGALQDYIRTNGDIIVDPTVDIYPDVGGKLVSLRVSLGSRVVRGHHIADVDRSTPGSSYELNPVRSTISGTVTYLPLATGATVTTSTVIAKVGELDNLQVEAKIPERYVGVLRTGLKAQVSLEAYPGESFPATVTRVSPLVDSASRTKEIRLTFDRADPRINAGMFVRLRIETTRYDDRLLVSESSVLADSTGRYVFVVDKESAVARRDVAVGAEVDGVLEIVSGLSEGERIVNEGASLLSDGAKVKDISVQGASK